MGKIRCGFSRAKITPVDMEVYLDGYGFRLTPAVGVYSDIYVNVCAFVSGEERFIIASFDLCGMSKRVYDIVSGQICQLTGLDRAHMAICNTHTHSGPGCGVLELVPINYDYFMFVGEAAGKAAVEALEKAVPGSFKYSIPGEVSWSFNRRGRKPIIDRRIKTAVFVDEAGVVRGSIVNASCHAVINTTFKISPDFLGVLNDYASDECPAVYLQGRGADINPANLTNADMDGFINSLGEEIAKADETAINTAKESAGKAVEDDSKLNIVYEKITVPMKEYPPMEAIENEISGQRARFLECAPDDINRHFALAELNYFEMAREWRENAQPGDRPALKVPVQTLSILGAVFMFIPFELLTLTGNKLEEMAKALGYNPEEIIIAGYSNTVNGYLAPEEEFAFGGYEVSGAAHWYRIPECAPDSEKAVLDWFEKNIK